MMFWDHNTVPSNYIEDLLNDENVTLEQILEDENVIQECKAQNSKLIDFLTKGDMLHRLVRHLVTEPDTTVDTQLQYRHANLAAEIVACTVPAIVDQLSQQRPLLDRLCQLLEQQPPLNPLLASYFARTLSLLIVRGSDQSWYSYQINCPQVLEYLRSRANFVDRLLVHIDTSAIMDLVCALATGVELPECRQTTQKWLHEQRLMVQLAALISCRQSADRQCNAAETLVALVQQARLRDTQRDAHDDTEHNPLIEAINTEEFVNVLLDAMLSGFDVDCDQFGSPPVATAAAAATPSSSSSCCSSSLITQSHCTAASGGDTRETAAAGVPPVDTVNEQSEEHQMEAVDDSTTTTAAAAGSCETVDHTLSTDCDMTGESDVLAVATDAATTTATATTATTAAAAAASDIAAAAAAGGVSVTGSPSQHRQTEAAQSSPSPPPPTTATAPPAAAAMTMATDCDTATVPPMEAMAAAAAVVSSAAAAATAVTATAETSSAGVVAAAGGTPPAAAGDSGGGGGGGRCSALVHGVSVLLCLLDKQHLSSSHYMPPSSQSSSTSLDSQPGVVQQQQQQSQPLSQSPDKQCVDSSATPAAGGGEGGESPGDDWRSIETACTALLPRLPQLHAILTADSTATSCYSSSSSSGGGGGSCSRLQMPPLGVQRLVVAQLVAALVAVGRADINAQLCRLNTLKTLLELFFRFSLNNFLHAHVERCVSYAVFTGCSGERDVTTTTTTSSSSSSSHDNQLLTHLFVECHILERILDGLSEPDSCPPSSPSPRCWRSMVAYRGHLVNMANYIQEAAARGVNRHQLQLLLNQQQQQQQQTPLVPVSVTDAWKEFCNSKLKQINERNKVYDLKSNEQNKSNDIDHSGSVIRLCQNASNFSQDDGVNARTFDSSLWKDSVPDKLSGLVGDLPATVDSTSWDTDELMPSTPFSVDAPAPGVTAEMQFERQCSERLSCFSEATTTITTTASSSSCSDRQQQQQLPRSSSPSGSDGSDSSCNSSSGSSSCGDADGSCGDTERAVSRDAVASGALAMSDDDEDANDDDDEDDDDQSGVVFDDQSAWPSADSPMDSQSAEEATAEAVEGGGGGFSVFAAPNTGSDNWADFDSFNAGAASHSTTDSQPPLLVPAPTPASAAGGATAAADGGSTVTGHPLESGHSGDGVYQVSSSTSDSAVSTAEPDDAMKADDTCCSKSAAAADAETADVDVTVQPERSALEDNYRFLASQRLLNGEVMADDVTTSHVS